MSAVNNNIPQSRVEAILREHDVDPKTLDFYRFPGNGQLEIRTTVDKQADLDTYAEWLRSAGITCEVVSYAIIHMKHIARGFGPDALYIPA